MADKFFRTLTLGTRFSKDQLDAVKVERNINNEKKEASLSGKLDFFASDAKEVSEEDKTGLLKMKRASAKALKSVEEVNVHRKKKNIKVYGSDIPAPVLTFEGMIKLGVPQELVIKLKEAGLRKPTPVQQQAVPVLAQNRDAFVIAPTGSGKTLAFLLGLMTKLVKKGEGVEGKVRAVIVSPTRELAQQIAQEISRFGEAAAFLSGDLLDQWKAKKPKSFPEIIVTSPLRLIHGIKRKVLDLSQVEALILDEADKLLELGFLAQMDKILAACTRPSLQKCLFSATIPTGVEEAARSFMMDPVRVQVGVPNAAVKTVEQKLVYVGQEEGKLMAIEQMLQSGNLAPPVVIFAETKERAGALVDSLKPRGIRIDCIHSGRSPEDRARCIADFRSGALWFLVTTELLARGLDFPNVRTVINYDFPTSTASYIHRIGRTARAGKEGRALTLYTKEDAESLRLIVNVMRQSGCEVPQWMLELRAKPSGKAIRAKKDALKQDRKLRHRRQELFEQEEKEN